MLQALSEPFFILFYLIHSVFILSYYPPPPPPPVTPTVWNFMRTYRSIGSENRKSLQCIDPEIMKQCKQYYQEFPTVFLLPNSPLTKIKGFEHKFDTGNAKPSYRKSLKELRAVCDKIERMLKFKILEPSNSEWGEPCILVRKPLENGQLQPPRFVVDYRGLNSVTRSADLRDPSEEQPNPELNKKTPSKTKLL